MEFTFMNLSHSLEDYLEVIARLEHTQGHAHANEIAQMLDVRMPSVTTALKTLCERGHVLYQPYKPIIMTEKGKRLAEHILVRHEVLRAFFSDILGVNSERANKVACQMEHLIDDDLLHRLATLNQSLIHGHADLIKQLHSHLEQKVKKNISLDELKVGEQGVIMEIADGISGLQKFAELGVIHGARVVMEEPAPLGDPLRVRVMGSVLMFRKEQARYISVMKVIKGDKK